MREGALSGMRTFSVLREGSITKLHDLRLGELVKTHDGVWLEVTANPEIDLLTGCWRVPVRRIEDQDDR